MQDGRAEDSPSIELCPVIAELFRTCVRPPSLLLRIEHVVHQKLAGQDEANLDEPPKKTHTSKLYLTDGQLSIQGLLHRKVISSLRDHDTAVGNLVEVHEFQVKKATRKSGHGDIVYLGIQRCTFFSADSQSATDQNHSVTVHESSEHNSVEGPLTENNHKADRNASDGTSVRNQPEHRTPESPRKTEKRTTVTDLKGATSQRAQIDATRIAHNSAQERNSTKEADMIPNTSTQVVSTSAKKKRKLMPTTDETGDEDAFETRLADLDTARKNRHVLHGMDQEALSSQSQFQSRHGPGSYPSVAPSPREQNLDRKDIIANTTSDIVQRQFSEEQYSEQSSIDEAFIPPISAQRQRTPPPPPPPTPPETVRPRTTAITSAPLVTTAPTSPTAAVTRPSAQPFEPPFHTLASLVHPPRNAPLPRKNYVLTTFATITYVGRSLLSRPNSPFPPKRHIKIEDPSLHSNTVPRPSRTHGPSTRGVTVAVYRDAANFKPEVGTIALFRGLVMQRLANGDVILNAYSASVAKFGVGANHTLANPPRPRGHKNDGSTSQPSTADHSKLDREPGPLVSSAAMDESAWFVTSTAVLKELGYDVDGMRSWWAKRQGDRTS